jgi:microcystin-dependent protein
MGLETATYITDLVATYPRGTDSKAQGDNHIRLLKEVLQAQFPYLGSAAVTATAADLNVITGGASSIYDLVYPVGSIYETTSSTSPNTLFAGTTWVRYGDGKVTVGQDSTDTDFDNINDTGGSKTVTLTSAQMPSHDHSFSGTTDTETLTGSFQFTDDNSPTMKVRAKTASGIASTSNSGTASHVNSDGVPSAQNLPNQIDLDASHNHSISGTSGTAGSGSAHENMPPYAIVYRWKRTA